jgi:hypothetical protein
MGGFTSCIRYSQTNDLMINNYLVCMILQAKTAFEIQMACYAVLLTGRLFGRVTQKGPNKKQSSQAKLWSNFARFCTERAEHLNISFSPLILSNSVQIKEILYVSQSRRGREQHFYASKKSNLAGGGQISTRLQPESLAKSCQHCCYVNHIQPFS